MCAAVTLTCQWCEDLTFILYSHCRFMQVGPCHSGRRAAIHTVTQGPRLTEAPALGHHQGNRSLQTCPGASQESQPGRVTCHCCSYFFGHNQEQDLNDSRGWEVVFPVCPGVGEKTGHACTTLHTSSQQVQFQKVILSKYSEKFMKMLEERISSYP